MLTEWHSATSPDPVPDVIHDAAQRPSGRRRSGIVDNSAEKIPPDVHKLSPGPSPIGVPAKKRTRKKDAEKASNAMLLSRKECVR